MVRFGRMLVPKGNKKTQSDDVETGRNDVLFLRWGLRSVFARAYRSASKSIDVIRNRWRFPVSFSFNFFCFVDVSCSLVRKNTASGVRISLCFSMFENSIVVSRAIRSRLRRCCIRGCEQASVVVVIKVVSGWYGEIPFGVRKWTLSSGLKHQWLYFLCSYCCACCCCACFFSM